MGSVKQCWIRQYGEEEGLVRWEEHVSKNLRPSLENRIRKLGLEEGTRQHLLWKENQKGKGGLEGFISKYGEEEGTRKYLEKNSRLSVGVETLKSLGYSEEQIEDIRGRHRKNSLVSLEALQLKYGEVEGKRKWDLSRERKRITSKRSLDYWLKIHNGDLESAKKSLADYQRIDENSFIRKHGPIDGPRLYAEMLHVRNKNWKNKTYNNSKGQRELEEFVRSNFPEKDVKGVAENWAIFLNASEKKMLGQQVIYPDILLYDDKIILEYQGDYWHAGPSLFPDPNAIHPASEVGWTVQQCRDHDEIRLDVLRNRGYRCFIVWESEWQSNKEEIKKFIMEKLT
jgi:G:T-mismatch repair DNA endonuclease (very short patch repair protein)